MEKKIYIVLHENPKYDDVDYAVFADREEAEKEYSKWRDYIEKNFNADEADEDTPDIFRRFDYSYGNSMPFVSIDEVAYTKDDKRILTEDII